MASAGIVTVTVYVEPLETRLRRLEHAAIGEALLPILQQMVTDLETAMSDLRAHQQWWSSLKPHQRLARRIRGMCRT